MHAGRYWLVGAEMRNPTAHSNRLDGLLNIRVVWSDGEIYDDTVAPMEREALGGVLYLPPLRVVAVRMFPQIRHTVAELDHVTESGVAVYLEVEND